MDNFFKLFLQLWSPTIKHKSKRHQERGLPVPAIINKSGRKLKQSPHIKGTSAVNNGKAVQIRTSHTHETTHVSSGCCSISQLRHTITHTHHHCSDVTYSPLNYNLIMWTLQSMHTCITAWTHTSKRCMLFSTHPITAAMPWTLNMDLHLEPVVPKPCSQIFTKMPAMLALHTCAVNIYTSI